MLASVGQVLTPQSKVLDFCCGSGKCVRYFRQEGYDVQGFEPFDEEAPATAEFKTLGWKNPYKRLDPNALPDLTVDWSKFRAPYDDRSFDFVYSQEVLEHVSDHEACLRELARITKPLGAGVHTFPAMYRPMECHLRIPFGNLLKAYWYYRLWLALFPFNPWPIRLDRRGLARLAYWYAAGSLNYLSPGEALRLARKYFRKAALVPHLWDSRLSDWLYSRTRHVVLLVAEPR